MSPIATPPLLAELLAGLKVLAITPISGGDINSAFQVDTDKDRFFAKCNANPGEAMFAREGAGLRALLHHGPPELGVPEVFRESASGLLLEWIDSGARSSATETAFGLALARLHQVSNPTFGGLDADLVGYLGSVPIDLSPTTSWTEFFFERRVRPLAHLAIKSGSLPRAALSLLDDLAPRVPELCGPPEPPALLHGDLWAGNRMVDIQGQNWLIDPAAHWGHRECDLAMMQLFGGFGTEAFAAYDEAFPLSQGWQSRVGWYQLPPLLVHAILFGAGYGQTVMHTLRSYS